MLWRVRLVLIALGSLCLGLLLAILSTVGLGRFAASLIRGGIRIFPKYRLRWLPELALAYERMGSVNQAITCLTEVVQRYASGEGRGFCH
jgi:hypothetical protein